MAQKMVQKKSVAGSGKNKDVRVTLGVCCGRAALAV
jgi:hypothetical protein